MRVTCFFVEIVQTKFYVSLCKLCTSCSCLQPCEHISTLTL